MSEAIVTAFYAWAGISFACWFLSVVTREYSWVDRIWSLAPQAYVAWFAYDAGFANPRVNIMLVLTSLWGARLTFNFARRGGYAKGGEDYRWAILRKRLGPALYQVFNATFIAPYQNFLLFAIALPAGIAAQSNAPLTPADFVLSVLFLLLLAGETIADQQQWNFHARKQAGKTALPFNDEGLFRYSRHPNFICEVSQWWVIYAFSVIATGAYYNFSIVGAVLLTLLFQGSTAFTEKITLSKYPQYAEYQRRTSRLIPMPPRAGKIVDSAA